jgi:hypothetical protein
MSLTRGPRWVGTGIRLLVSPAFAGVVRCTYHEGGKKEFSISDSLRTSLDQAPNRGGSFLEDMESFDD